jgi:hypothetical protein
VTFTCDDDGVDKISGVVIGTVDAFSVFVLLMYTLYKAKATITTIERTSFFIVQS